MHTSTTVVIKSSSPSDEEAIALIDGKIPLPVLRTRRPAPDISALEKSDGTLAMANHLLAAGEHREAFKWAIRAAREVLWATGTPSSEHAPLEALFAALTDLDRGVKHPALNASTANRPGETAAEWNARACLAGAIDIKMRNGATEAAAAEEVRRSTAIIPGSPTIAKEAAVRRLTSWRKQLRSTTPPPEGSIVYQATLDTLELTASMFSGDALRERLIAMGGAAIARAEHFRTQAGATGR